MIDIKYIRGENMNKKLPKVYANRIEKKIENNKKVDYSSDSKPTNSKQELRNVEEIHQKTQKNINQKLNDIFNSPRYVYKAEVEIKMKDKTIIKKIVGQNQNQLITLDNELIPISDILDIDFVK